MNAYYDSRSFRLAGLWLTLVFLFLPAISSPSCRWVPGFAYIGLGGIAVVSGPTNDIGLESFPAIMMGIHAIAFMTIFVIQIIAALAPRILVRKKWVTALFIFYAISSLIFHVYVMLGPENISVGPFVLFTGIALSYFGLRRAKLITNNSTSQELL
jgi:hypothetical protein